MILLDWLDYVAEQAVLEYELVVNHLDRISGDKAHISSKNVSAAVLSFNEDFGQQ